MLPPPGARRPPARGPGSLERTVRASLGACVAALLGALVAAQYVGAPWLGWLVPLLVGLLCAAAARAAAGAARPSAAVRGVGCLYAVLGVALSLRLEGSVGLHEAAALVPAAAAALGALLETPPVGRRRPVSPAGG